MAPGAFKLVVQTLVMVECRLRDLLRTVWT